MIKIINADKSFKDQCIYENLNLEINQPGIYFIEGKSGSGKTTLLNMLVGIDKFDHADSIQIDDNIAMIFQNYELIDELNIENNILLSKPKDEYAEEVIRKLGLNDLLNHYPYELSGGQKQRVGIARVLLLKPNIIICDEPTESLDIDNKNIVMNLLQEMSLNKIVIISSHDQKIIQDYADCIYEIKDKKLHLIKSYKTSRELAKEKQIQNNDIRKLMKRIIKKKTMASSIVISICIMLISGLFIFQSNIFKVPDTTNKVNANILYLEKIGDVVEDERLNKFKLILGFDFAAIGADEMHFDIYPYVDNKLSLEGKAPKDHEVVINKNIAEGLNLKLGDNIDLYFTILAEQSKFTMKISGIVDESDTKKGSIYYNNESIMKELENMKMFDGRTYLSYLKDNGKYYQTYSDYTQTENSIRLYSDIENIKVYNPLYDERMEEKEEGQSFQLVFKIVNICLFGGLIIFVILYLNKDSKKMMKICSILVSLQNSVKEMKNVYCKYKILNLFIFLFIEVIFMSSAIYLMKFDIKEYLLILLGINAIVLIVYSACVYLNAQNLREEKIADILKNNID